MLLKILQKSMGKEGENDTLDIDYFLCVNSITL
jgi:hypothetical protein